MSYMNEASFFHGYKVFYRNSDGSSGSTIFGDPISSEEIEDPISVVILFFLLRIRIELFFISLLDIFLISGLDCVLLS